MQILTATPAPAIKSNITLDFNVYNKETIEIELEDEELFHLMRLAHEQDITLNQLINNALQALVDHYETPGFKDAQHNRI